MSEQKSNWMYCLLVDFFFKKKKSWKGISEHVSFSLFHMHSGTKAQANIGWLADVKGEEIRTKKGS